MGQMDLPNYDRWKTCVPETDDGTDVCPDCDGSGEIGYIPTTSWMGRPEKNPENYVSGTCPKCEGEGVIALDPGEHPRSCRCPDCDPDSARDEEYER